MSFVGKFEGKPCTVGLERIPNIMDDLGGAIISSTEIIKDRFYFWTIQPDVRFENIQENHYFCIEKELIYENFYKDFGPLNLGMLYKYCCIVEKKLKAVDLQKKKIIHCTTLSSKKRVNAAFLAGSYAILYQKKSAAEVYDALVRNAKAPAFIMFRDASIGPPRYQISLKDCLNAIEKCHKLGFFNFDDFNLQEYAYYEKVENGDLNWIVPDKFVAFCGPHATLNNENGYPLHAPESYFSYFRANNVTTIVRLNTKIYDASQFINAGFDHKDLFFRDGSTPTEEIVRQFFEISEKTSGAVAIHCKAGLGRTGTLIACFIMKHYHLSAHEAIAWIRICRPGSVIGHQQLWLEENESFLRSLNTNPLRAENGNPPHSRGIYSEIGRSFIIPTSLGQDNVSGIVHRVDDIRLDDSSPTTSASGPSRFKTQGDKLNEIKIRRQTSTNAFLIGRKANEQPAGFPNLENVLQTRAKNVRSERYTMATLIGPKKETSKRLLARSTTTTLVKRNTWRVSGNCKPSSCYVRPKSTMQLHSKTTAASAAKPVGKPVTRSAAKETPSLPETRSTISTINRAIQQSESDTMVLRSADRVSRYKSMRHARTTISSKTAFIR